MTKLERDARVRREVDGGRFGPLVIEARAEGLYTRAKGTRTWYGPLSWESLHVDGAKRTADRKRREKEGKRNPRKRRRSAKIKVGT